MIVALVSAQCRALSCCVACVFVHLLTRNWRRDCRRIRASMWVSPGRLVDAVPVPVPVTSLVAMACSHSWAAVIARRLATLMISARRQRRRQRRHRSHQCAVPTSHALTQYRTVRTSDTATDETAAPLPTTRDTHATTSRHNHCPNAVVRRMDDNAPSRKDRRRVANVVIAARSAYSMERCKYADMLWCWRLCVLAVFSCRLWCSLRSRLCVQRCERWVRRTNELSFLFLFVFALTSLVALLVGCQRLTL